MAGFAGGGELELHLLVVHQVCQVVRRRDQAVRLAVADVNPPGGRECTACSERIISVRVKKQERKLLYQYSCLSSVK